MYQNMNEEEIMVERNEVGYCQVRITVCCVSTSERRLSKTRRDVTMVTYTCTNMTDLPKTSPGQDGVLSHSG